MTERGDDEVSARFILLKCGALMVSREQISCRSTSISVLSLTFNCILYQRILAAPESINTLARIKRLAVLAISFQ